jgi:beta-phosphoglucomutase
VLVHELAGVSILGLPTYSVFLRRRRYLMDYEAILFDLDGVLVDTEHLHFQCWQTLLKPHGINLDWTTYLKNYVGVSDLEMLQQCVGLRGHTFALELFNNCYQRKNELFKKTIMTSQLTITPGLTSFLISLRPLKLAVVSSSDRSEVNAVLAAANLHSLFDVVVCGNEVSRRKPAPDPYIKAAEILAIRRALVVEDSSAGEASGLAAGFDVVRISSPSEMLRAVSKKLGR